MKWLSMMLLLVIAPPAQTEFSKLYTTYIKDFKEVVVYQNGRYGAAPKARVFAKGENAWQVFDHYLSKVHLEDSVVRRKPIGNQRMASVLADLQLDDVKNEKDLDYFCVQRLDTSIRTSAPRSLNEMEDIAYHTVEYCWNGKSRRIVYKDPWEALKLCPYSEERKKLITVINTLTNLE